MWKKSTTSKALKAKSKSTQLKWISYRDSWATLCSLLYKKQMQPAVAEISAKLAVTRDRIEELRHSLST